MPDRVHGRAQQVHTYRTRQEQLRKTIQEINAEGNAPSQPLQPAGQASMSSEQMQRLEWHRRLVDGQQQLTAVRLEMNVDDASDQQEQQAMAELSDLLNRAVEASGLLRNPPRLDGEVAAQDLAGTHRRTERLVAFAHRLG